MYFNHRRIYWLGGVDLTVDQSEYRINQSNYRISVTCHNKFTSSPVDMSIRYGNLGSVTISFFVRVGEQDRHSPNRLDLFKTIHVIIGPIFFVI